MDGELVELFVFKYVGVFVRAVRSQNTLLKAVDQGKFVAWYIGAVAVEGGLITVADTLKVKSTDFLNLNLILFFLSLQVFSLPSCDSEVPCHPTFC